MQHHVTLVQQLAQPVAFVAHMGGRGLLLAVLGAFVVRAMFRLLVRLATMAVVAVAASFVLHHLH